MKKYTMLGVNSRTNECCVLYCLIPFENLVPSELEKTDFTHESTNWCGRDEIERTLKIIKMKPTGKEIFLIRPIEFFGCDSDMGHSYSWTFKIDTIYELEEN